MAAVSLFNQHAATLYPNVLHNNEQKNEIFKKKKNSLNRESRPLKHTVSFIILQ